MQGKHHLKQGGDSRKRAASITTPRETATQKARRRVQFDEQLSVITGEALIELNQTYQCQDKNCSNYQHPCVKAGKIGHLRLTNDDLRRWDEQIRSGKAGVDSCPSDLLADMIMRKDEREGKKRKGTVGVAVGAAVGASPQTVNHFHIGVGSMGMGGELAFKPPTLPEPPSSPVAQEGDDRALLAEYMDWLIERNLIDDVEGQSAKDELRTAHWGFANLKSISEKQWVSLRVPTGLAFQICKQRKVWIAFKKVSKGKEREVIDIDDL